MPSKLTETSTDIDGAELPDGLYAVVDANTRRLSGYKVRWREKDEYGNRVQRSSSFSLRKHGDANTARSAAHAHLLHVSALVRSGDAVARPDAAAKLTLNDVHRLWIEKATDDGRGDRHVEDYGDLWEKHISERIGKRTLAQIVDDPDLISQYALSLSGTGMSKHTQRKVIGSLNRALRLAEERWKRVVTRPLAIPLPPIPKSDQIAKVTTAVAIERVIEQVGRKRSWTEITTARNVALTSALAHTVASRPSEWLNSATWDSIGKRSVSFSRPDYVPKTSPGLKTGKRVSVLTPVARDRILAYKAMLEAEHGPQPGHGLVFAVLDPRTGAPLWDGVAPVRWKPNDWRRWTSRVWRPAQTAALGAPDVRRADGFAPELASITAYNLRHTAITLALRSTLYQTAHGPDVYRLAQAAGHDATTLQRDYASWIAEYDDDDLFELDEHLEQARLQVERSPYIAPRVEGPQTVYARRNRARKRAVKESA